MWQIKLGAALGTVALTGLVGAGVGVGTTSLKQMSTQNVMNLDEAKKIWGDAMPADDLKKWLELKNKRNPERDDTMIPKGVTVEVDPKTGKVVPRSDY